MERVVIAVRLSHTGQLFPGVEACVYINAHIQAKCELQPLSEASTN